MNEITTTSENEKRILALVLKKYEYRNALNKIDKTLSLFRKEAAVIVAKLHITKDGNVCFIPNMETSHLLNTIALIAKANGSLNCSRCEKYVEEAKSRGLIDALISIGESLDSSDEDEDYED